MSNKNMQHKNLREAQEALSGITGLYNSVKDKNQVMVVGVQSANGAQIVEGVKAVDVAAEFGRVAVKVKFPANETPVWFDTGQLYLYRVSDENPLTIVEPDKS